MNKKKRIKAIEHYLEMSSLPGGIVTTNPLCEISHKIWEEVGKMASEDDNWIHHTILDFSKRIKKLEKYAETAGKDK